jgi:NAD+ diphosphatase
MVIPRSDGRVLVMTKEFYPEGVYRLPSGKLHGDESPDDGLHRELFEETGFRLGARNIGCITYCFECNGRNSKLASYMYMIDPIDDEPVSQDADEQIGGFGYASAHELRAIAERLRSLPGHWQDWGRFRAIAHDHAADALATSH